MSKRQQASTDAKPRTAVGKAATAVRSALQEQAQSAQAQRLHWATVLGKAVSERPKGCTHEELVEAVRATIADGTRLQGLSASNLSKADAVYRLVSKGVDAEGLSAYSKEHMYAAALAVDAGTFGPETVLDGLASKDPALKPGGNAGAAGKRGKAGKAEASEPMPEDVSKLAQEAMARFDVADLPALLRLALSVLNTAGTAADATGQDVQAWITKAASASVRAAARKAA